MVGGEPEGAGGGCVTTVGGIPITEPEPPPVEDEVALLSFGNENVGADTTTRSMDPWYTEEQAESTVGLPPRIIAPFGAVIDRLYIYQADPRGNGGNITYTLFVNGGATALTATLASTSMLAFDLANSVAVAQGDTLQMIVTKGVAVGTSPQNVTAQMRMTPT